MAFVVPLAAALAAGLPERAARANDSSALLGAGGIVLTVSKDVSMDSEELWISRTLVRVQYVFTNSGPADVKTEVAFPVPGIPVCDDPDDGACEQDIQIERGDNPMRFKLTVDGKTTPFKTDRRREMKKGVGKLWITHHWEQVFPKGRSVRIAHEYVPVAGSTFTDTSKATNGAFEREMAGDYCVGPKLMRTLTAREQVYWVVHYILTTGANWKGPIKSFKLTIAKDAPGDKVSVCIPDTRRVSPTTFEVVRRDFVPTSDLKILFVPATP